VAREVVAEVERVVVDAQLVGHPTGVVDVADRAAARVALAAPELEGDAHHLVALVAQQGGRHRRVDAARHHHQHPHSR
jgi:hypothetical protein